MNQPQPVTVKIVCSMCGLDWNRHGDDPTTEDCVRLLRQELSSRPYPRVWYLPTYPVYGSSTHVNNYEVRTPRVA